MLGQIAPFRPGFIASIAAWTTLVACAGLAIADLVLSAITPDYNMVGDTSSQLMSPDARYSSVARVILGLYAALLVPFAAGLSNRFPGKPVAGALAVTGIWVHIAATLISAVALNDSEAGILGGISTNEIHDQAAVLMFGAALAVLTGATFGSRTDRSTLRMVTFFAFGMLLLLGPVFMAEVWTQLNGVMERLLAASFMTWLAVTAWSWRDESNRQVAKRP